MQKVIVRIDWYTKTILTVIAALLFGMLAKPLIMPEKAVAEQEKDTFNISPASIRRMQNAARIEGTAERAEGDAEQMYRFIQPGLSSEEREEGLVVKTELIESEYYQEHPYGRLYLKYLIEETQTTERARLFLKPASSVIRKIGDRYFVYDLK